MSRWILKDDLELFDCTNDQVSGIVVDNDENIYFTLFGSIWKQSANDDWNFQVLAQQKDVFLESLVWDGKNTIFAADSSHHQIYTFDLLSEKLSLFAGTGYGCDDGKVKECSFQQPKGLALYNQNLFVCDEYAIRKIDMKEGIVSSKEARKVSSITADDQGTIYVADDRVIRRIIPQKDGYETIIAGDSSKYSTHQCDGPALGAYFQDITSIMYHKGKLLVADFNTLRSVDLEKEMVSTECEFGINPLCLAKSDRYLYIGTESGILRLEEAWKAERFLWIGKYKEQAQLCNFAKLPKEIIKEIASHLGERKKEEASLK